MLLKIRGKFCCWWIHQINVTFHFKHVSVVPWPQCRSPLTCLWGILVSYVQCVLIAKVALRAYGWQSCFSQIISGYFETLNNFLQWCELSFWLAYSQWQSSFNILSGSSESYEPPWKIFDFLLAGPNSSQRRRGRQTYSRYQTLELEKEFQFNHYLTRYVMVH